MFVVKLQEYLSQYDCLPIPTLSYSTLQFIDIQQSHLQIVNQNFTSQISWLIESAPWKKPRLQVLVCLVCLLQFHFPPDRGLLVEMYISLVWSLLIILFQVQPETGKTMCTGYDCDHSLCTDCNSLHTHYHYVITLCVHRLPLCHHAHTRAPLKTLCTFFRVNSAVTRTVLSHVLLLLLQ